HQWVKSKPVLSHFRPVLGTAPNSDKVGSCHLKPQINSIFPQHLSKNFTFINRTNNTGFGSSESPSISSSMRINFYKPEPDLSSWTLASRWKERLKQQNHILSHN
ncbi:hypothetical protein XENORESO_002213, partial [Xenotaenia resolanae]